MNEKINHARALLSANDLAEALTALKYDTRFAYIHRENIEQALIDLGRELGFTVSPITALDTARLADDVAAMAPVRALEAAQ